MEERKEAQVLASETQQDQADSRTDASSASQNEVSAVPASDQESAMKPVVSTAEALEQQKDPVPAEAQRSEVPDASSASKESLTPEENKQLRSGARFFHKAMESMSAAQGENYHPYRIPPQMRAALADIDAQAVAEKRKELEEQAAAEGRELTEEEIREQTRTLSRLHAVDPDEEEEMKHAQAEKERIDAGGARFFHKYQALVSDQQGYKESVRQKMKRNLKIFGIVMIGLAGYMAYNEYFVDREAQTLSELKSMLPMPIDAYTTMVRIDDRTDFKIFFERDPAAYKNVDEHQKQADLDKLGSNALALCKNQLLYGIISSGKKVTVLLDAADGTFHRQFTVETCPAMTLAEGK